MHSFFSAFIGLLLLTCVPSQAGLIKPNRTLLRFFQTEFRSASSFEQLGERQRPSPLLKAFRLKQKKDKKIIAALLAFPFPFGIVGLHRIYLGCAPYVPVAYIASLGGIFGTLPFIDFCVLLIEKDLDKYINSKKIFMWVN